MDAYDRVRLGVDEGDLANHGRVAMESFLPRAVSDDGNTRWCKVIESDVAGCDESSERGTDRESRVVVAYNLINRSRERSAVHLDIFNTASVPYERVGEDIGPLLDQLE